MGISCTKIIFDFILHHLGKQFQVEYIGHCTFKPIIKFREDPYAEPEFPPKMKWYNVYNNKEVMGEIFMVAEMIEVQ